MKQLILPLNMIMWKYKLKDDLMYVKFKYA